MREAGFFLLCRGGWGMVDGRIELCVFVLILLGFAVLIRSMYVFFFWVGFGSNENFKVRYILFIFQRGSGDL